MPEPTYGNLDFAEAILFFLGKIAIPTAHWTDVWRDGHDTAFMVAGADHAAIVQDFHEAVAKAIVDGTTLAEFRRDFDVIVARYGWDYHGTRGWRSRLIFETNLNSAYQAGRYAQLTDPDFQAVYPYWEYDHSELVEDPRPEHVAWDGLVLRADDPWWQSHYPPNGWGCRCRVRPRSERQLRRQGKRGPDSAPPTKTHEWIDPATGQVHQVPEGIDPGWDYAPGASLAPRIRQQVERRAGKLLRVLAEALRALIASPPPPPPLPEAE